MTLGTLNYIIGLDSTQFDTGVTTASGKMTALKGEMGGLQDEATKTGGILDSAFGHALGDILSGITEAAIETAFSFAQEGVGIASSMEALETRLSMTFGNSSAYIQSWAKTAKASFGMGQVSAITYAAELGDALKRTGASEAELAVMSTKLAGVAADLGAFYNRDAADAIEAIMSAFRGEADPIEKFALNMNESSMAAYAVSKGLIEAEKGWSKLSDAEKVMARYSYIMDATADKQGFFADNSDKFNMQLAAMEANLEQLKLTMGEALLPVLNELVTWFNNLFGGSEDASASIGEMSKSLGETYATIDSTTANALALVEALAEMEAAGVDTAEEQSVWNKLLADLTKTMPGLDAVISTTTGHINGGTEALKSYIAQWQATQHEMAIATVLQSAQNDILKQAASVAQLEYELKASRLTASEVEAQQAQLLDRARQYLGMEDVLDAAPVGMELLDRAESGDAYANYLMTRLEALGGNEENTARLESELLAAQSKLADLNARYTELEQSVTNLSQEIEKPEAAAPSTEDVAAAAAEGAKAGAADAPGAPVTIVLNATIDGNDVASALETRIMNKINWKLQAQQKG